MNYEDLIKAHNEPEIKEDKTYERLILPITNPWESLDSVIEFVRIWNKRVPIGKNKDEIKKAAFGLSEYFRSLEHYNLEDFEFTLQNTTLIKEIFNKLFISVLKSTGTTKLMHGINPKLFVMWDKGICEHYGCYPNSAGYIIFMKLMQEEAREVLKGRSKEEIIRGTNRTLAKLIDEYNWVHYRTSKMK